MPEEQQEAWTLWDIYEALEECLDPEHTREEIIVQIKDILNALEPIAVILGYLSVTVGTANEGPKAEDEPPEVKN